MSFTLKNDHEPKLTIKGRSGRVINGGSVMIEKGRICVEDPLPPLKAGFVNTEGRSNRFIQRFHSRKGENHLSTKELTEKLSVLTHQALSNRLKFEEISGRVTKLIDNFEENDDSPQSACENPHASNSEDSITVCHDSLSIPKSRTSDVLQSLHQTMQNSTVDEELDNQDPSEIPLVHDVQTSNTSNVDAALQQTTDVKQRLGSALSHLSKFAQLQVAGWEQKLQETLRQLEERENQCEKLERQVLVRQNEIERQSQEMKESAEEKKRLCNVIQEMKTEHEAKVHALQSQIHHIKESHEQSERMLYGKIVTIQNAESDAKRHAHQLKVKLELAQTEILSHKKEIEEFRAHLHRLSEFSEPKSNPNNLIGIERDFDSKTGQMKNDSCFLIKKHEAKALLSTQSEKKNQAHTTNITFSSPATMSSFSSSGVRRNQTYTHRPVQQTQRVLTQTRPSIQKSKGGFISPVESYAEVPSNPEESIAPSNNVSKWNEVKLSEVSSSLLENTNSNDLDDRPVLGTGHGDNSLCNATTQDDLCKAKAPERHPSPSKLKVWPIMELNCDVTVEKQEIVSEMRSKTSPVFDCDPNIKYDSSVYSSPSAKVYPAKIQHMRDRIEPLDSECVKEEAATKPQVVTAPAMLGLVSSHLSTDILKITFGRIGQLSARTRIETLSSELSPCKNVSGDGCVFDIPFKDNLSPNKAKVTPIGLPVDRCTSGIDLGITARDDITTYNQQNLISVPSHSPKAKVFPISQRNVVLYNTPAVADNISTTSAGICQPVMYPPGDTSKLPKASKVSPLCKSKKQGTFIIYS